MAINEGWDENYGQGGVPGGANIPFTVPVDNATVTFTYDATSHILTVVAEIPPGAPDGPGALSHFGLARKDCLGTARNTTSRVWYTIANGVLSDVYYPTIDNTNVETLQYVVTDGSTFTDLQTRDMTYTVEAQRDAGGMACTVTATATSGKYRIETDYVTDPGRNTVLMHVKFRPSIGGLRLYVRFDATVNGNGGGGPGNGGADRATIDDSTGDPVLVSFDPVTATNAANRDYAQPVYAALDGPFSEASSGFVGAASDGLVQLDASHALTTTYDEAVGGNVVQTARVEPRATGAAARPYSRSASARHRTWPSPRPRLAGHRLRQGAGSLRRRLASVRPLADEASHRAAAGPRPRRPEAARGRVLPERQRHQGVRGQDVPGRDRRQPRFTLGPGGLGRRPGEHVLRLLPEVFARDLYESWTGLVAAGDLATARDATLFLFERQQLPDGSMPRNSLVNGKVAPDSFGTQLDETAYPILMAYQLGLTDPSLYADHIKPAANFVASRGPAFGVERWEEQSGFSPSTIAAEIAGLVAAAELARANGDTASAAIWLGVADSWQRQVKDWTVTTSGPHASRYFIRLSKTGDPNAAISYNVGNGGPTLDQREVIDAGFLELARLGELPVADADIARSCKSWTRRSSP